MVAAALDNAGRAGGLATTAAGGWHAFLPAGAGASALHDLGILPGGDDSAAWDISAAGRIVGQATTAAGAEYAALWDGGVLRDREGTSSP